MAFGVYVALFGFLREVRAGKTVDEAANAIQSLAAKYKGYTIDPAKTKENTQYVYDELHLSGRYVP